MVIIRETKKSFFQTGWTKKMSGQGPSETLTDNLRALLQDLLRLGMAGAAGYANRMVSRIQLDYIVNPFGRQPPHALIFADGRTEPMTPFQLPVPGYAPDVLAIEPAGCPRSSTDAQLATVRLFGREIRKLLPGQMAFAGRQELVDIATAALEPVAEVPADVSAEQPSDADSPFPLVPTTPGPAFMLHETLALSTPQVPRPEPVVFSTQPSNVQEIFDIIGTPTDRRVPLAPGSIFKRPPVQPDGARRWTPPRSGPSSPHPARAKSSESPVIPSHDPFKPEPDEAQAYSLDELRRADQRVGMTEFRGHYILAKNGDLIPGGVSSWPATAGRARTTTRSRSYRPAMAAHPRRHSAAPCMNTAT